VTLRQVHSDVCVCADGRKGRIGEGDALFTGQPGGLLAVRTADCLPLLFADERRKAVAAVHAGWRGAIQRIAARVIETMQARFSSRPEDLLVAVGPGIGACCYEVGPEVAAAIRSSHHQPDLLLRPGRRPDSHFLDLWQANARQLADAGVRQIEIGGLCTACHRRLFFSHRADQGRTGRFGVLMILEE
jgi:YfiH family protein